MTSGGTGANVRAPGALELRARGGAGALHDAVPRRRARSAPCGQTVTCRSRAVRVDRRSSSLRTAA